MRVLLVGAASSVHLLRWAQALAGRGHEVHVATQHAPLAGYGAGVVVHRLPHLGGAGYLLNRCALRRLVDRIGPDVVNAHYASGYGTLAVRPAGAPLVLNVWGSDVYEFPDATPLHRWLLRRNLRRADAVVSTSEVMARRTAQVCPGLSPITVVPFGVNTQRFSARPVSKDALVVGTVKALAPKYGIDILLRAFAGLSAGRTEAVRLRIVGDGPQRSELEQLADDLGIKARVDFVGAVPHHQVPQELNRLDVYVALSRTHSESFGVAVIEASACGLPVVVSEAGGLPEVVERDCSGFIVPMEDSRAAAERIAELLADDALRARMGAAGRERVVKRYSWDDCVDRLLEVYGNALREMKR